VLPTRAKSIKEAVEINCEVWRAVKAVFERKYGFVGKNDEGALVAKVDDFKALEILSEIAGDHNAKIGLDFAATNFYKKGRYFFAGKVFSPNEFLDIVVDILKTYKVAYVEDPFHERDFRAFAELTKKVKSIICGDDLFATNWRRLRKGIEKKAGNAIIIKPNQVGTISLTLRTIELASKYGFICVASHRSGETCDPFIAEFALFCEVPILKCSVFGSERFAKWNKLIELWEKAKRPKMVKIRM
jgi:enolase